MKNIIIILYAIMLCTYTLELNAQTQWTKDPENPALLNGNPGAWNFDVFNPFVIYNEDSVRYEMWFVGGGDSYPYIYQIGYAVSYDGSDWTMPYSTPVLTATPGSWDSVVVFSPMVIRENGQYKMWYAGGKDDFNNKIGYASSPDGINWTKYADNPILSPDALWEKDAAGNHYVIHTESGYQMWYFGGINTWLSSGAIGYATSLDGITWVKDTDHNPVLTKGNTGEWDNSLVWAPRVLNLFGKHYMWYSGMNTSNQRRVGLATSIDGGITWTKCAINPVLNPTPSTWDAYLVQDGFVMLRGNTLHMWYTGVQSSSSGRFKIGHATSMDKLRLVPQIYPTIQAAIDASFDGDTVLVSDGTYYENIRFRGKKILVASTYVTTNDTSHILNTIIDGSNPSNPDSGSVVYFINGEDTTSVLCGFTITGGTGTSYFYYGGYWVRAGGGVFCKSAGARIVRNIITRNRLTAATVEGGGLFSLGDTLFLPYVVLEANRITDNYVRGDSAATWAWSGGAGIRNTFVRVVGNVFERDTVIGANMAVGGGMAIYSEPPVLLSEGYIQGNIFRANIAHATIGGSVGIGMCLVWTGEVTIMDNLVENNIGTSISGWAQGGGLCVTDENITGYGRKLISKNRFLSNQLSHGGATIAGGAGVHLYQTLATLNGNEISNNSAEGTGGGISIVASNFRLENNIITKNKTRRAGGGLDIAYTPLADTEHSIINNTIYQNKATYNGGGMQVRQGANIVSLNNIFWADTAQSDREIRVIGASANINYCNVQGGWSGTGNIDVNPLLSDSMYHLSDSSLCIGAGTDSMQITGVWYRAPQTCYYGGPRPNPKTSLPDLGACENMRATPASISAITVNQNWNIVSVPRIQNSYLKNYIFPSSISDAFLYNDGYEQKDTLENHIGYWVKFPYAHIVPVNGTLIETDTIDVIAGWNLIGSITTQVTTSSITSDPPGIVTSSFWGYIETGYFESGVINPGNGYWVKVNQPGSLIFSSSTEKNIAARIKIVPTAEMPPPAPSDGTNGIAENQTPKEFKLEQNYPNPFNPRTIINYQLPASSHVILKVYNLLGQEVVTLVNEIRDAGYKSVYWNASCMPSGVYIYRIQAGSFVSNKKLLLLK